MMRCSRNTETQYKHLKKALTRGLSQLTHCTQTVTCTFVEIECAVQPESRMHSNKRLIILSSIFQVIRYTIRPTLTMRGPSP